MKIVFDGGLEWSDHLIIGLKIDKNIKITQGKLSKVFFDLIDNLGLVDTWRLNANIALKLIFKRKKNITHYLIKLLYSSFFLYQKKNKS